MKLKLVLAAALALAASACAGPGYNKQDSGTLIGAGAGALIGNQFGKGGGRVAATIGGAVLGGIIGNQIGKSMDEEDRRRAAEAEYASLERGERVEWRNERTGRYGYYVPRRNYYRDGFECREYEQTIYIDGRPQTMTGRACRRPDGTWAAA